MSPAVSSGPRRGTPADLLLGAERDPRDISLGAWSLQLRGADLDDIRYGDEVVLRSVRFVVRDHDWSTVPNVSIDVDESATTLTLRVRASDGDAAVEWTLTATADGDSLAVDTTATVTSAFRRNRIGLIVLHPPAVAGSALTVTHPDGVGDDTEFPLEISPHQPAFQIAGLDWTAGETACSLRFTGDVFEMEDQRNWTDASFKTYSTPLELPFPVPVAAGETIAQSLVLTGRAGHDGSEPRGDTERVTVEVGQPTARRMPQLATSASSAPDRVPGGVPGGALPATSGAAVLLLELDPAWPNWRAALARAIGDAAGRPLDLRIVATEPAEIDEVLDAVLYERGDSALARIGVFARRGHLSEPALRLALATSLSERHLTPTLVGGTRGHFTELNRGESSLADWDGPLTFSIIPTMHDLSGHQVVESLEIQRRVAIDAVRIARGRSVHIGPITIRARFNAVATAPAPLPDTASVADGYGAHLVAGATDPRQGALSIGAWLLASVDALTAVGIESLSYFEEWGPRGLRTDTGATAASVTSADGSTPAAGVVFGWLAELEGAVLLHVAASDPRLVALAARTDSGTALVLGNLSATAVTAEVADREVGIQRTGLGVGLTIEPGEVVRLSVA